MLFVTLAVEPRVTVKIVFSSFHSADELFPNVTSAVPILILDKSTAFPFVVVLKTKRISSPTVFAVLSLSMMIALISSGTFTSPKEPVMSISGACASTSEYSSFIPNPSNPILSSAFNDAPSPILSSRSILLIHCTEAPVPA